MTNDYQTARHYWSHQNAAVPELLGVAALGGCGLTEVIYRHHEEVRHFMRLVPLARTTSLLELGCGNGRWVTALGPRVGHYTAVDFSAQMLAEARRRTTAMGLANVHFIEASAQDYVPERTFDVIYLSGVTQYLHDEDLSQLLQRLRPHLSSDGVIVDRSTLHRRARMMATQPGYFSIYRTGDELIQVFATAGWSNHYRARSYRFLNFSRSVQRVLGTWPIHRLVAATAPVSFAGLRLAAGVRDACFGPTGELVDYSHEFFLFRRPATT
jgi:SAM-dependent methyltransferase